MSTKLRQLAKQEQDALVFIAAHQRLWCHTPGTGLRELARIWERAHGSLSQAGTRHVR